MTWKVLPFVLVLSIAINIPFFAMWARSSRVTGNESAVGEQSTVSSKQPGESAPSNFEPPSPEKILREIGVTDEQWAHMETRHRAFQSAMQRNFKQSQRLNRELMDLIAAPATNGDAIRLKQEEICRGQREMQDLIVTNLLADKQDLTGDQQERLFEMLRGFFARYGGKDEECGDVETEDANELSNGDRDG